MTDTLDTALQWLDRSITPIPCKPRSKVAAVAWAHWQSEFPPVDLVRRWFKQPDVNLAIMCGRGLIVLDFDDIAAYLIWKNQHPDIAAQCYTVKTARGCHVYFYCDAPVSTMMNVEGCDVKASGYVLTAPSFHPSGAVYTAINGAPIMRIASLDEVVEFTHHKDEERPAIGEHKMGDCGVSAFHIELPHDTIRQDLIGRIRAHLPILNLVSRYTRPLPSSPDGRWFIACCPFHNDHAPSFWIDNVRGICGCYRPECRAQQPEVRPMDIFNFYSRLHHCSNREAVFALAKEVREA